MQLRLLSFLLLVQVVVSASCFPGALLPLPSPLRTSITRLPPPSTCTGPDEPLLLLPLELLRAAASAFCFCSAASAEAVVRSWPGEGEGTEDKKAEEKEVDEEVGRAPRSRGTVPTEPATRPEG